MNESIDSIDQDPYLTNVEDKLVVASFVDFFGYLKILSRFRTLLGSYFVVVMDWD